MQDPALDIFTLPAATFEEAIHQAAYFCADHFRDVLGQQNMESGVPQIKTHGAERIREGVGLGYQDFWSTRRLSSDHHGGRAITKQDRGNEIGWRNIPALKSERGQLHGNNQDVAAGRSLKIIGGTR